MEIDSRDALTMTAVVAVMMASCGRANHDQRVGSELTAMLAMSKDSGRGREIYFGRAMCVTCHTRTGDGLGPNLSNIREASRDRVPGWSDWEYVVASIKWPDLHLAPGRSVAMYNTVELSNQDIVDLAAYLMSMK